MNKIVSKIIILSLAVLSLAGCQKMVNDWEVDPAHDRLFRSIVFQSSRVASTEVEISYTKTLDADRYIFEFSKDSLEFATIVKTVEILADTLTPFAPSNSPAMVEYRTIFDELDGNSDYSVRMKGIDDDTQKESGYVEMFFKTPSEQILTGADIFVDRIVVRWEPTDRVTAVELAEPESGRVIHTVTLTQSDKTNGYVEISGLLAGTDYLVFIVNNDIVRGYRDVRTAGILGGEIIQVNPGDDIPTLVANALTAGKSDVMLLFAGGQTYNLGAIRLPSGVTNVSVTGVPNTTGEKPILNIRSFQLSDLTYGSVYFENAKIIAETGATFLVTENQNQKKVDGYYFRNCDISDFGNGVISVNNNVTLKDIVFDNCLINRNGGWGVVNIGGSLAVIDSVSFVNSTLTDLATQLMDVRVAVKKINVKNCTFYNQNVALTQLLRFETARLPLAIDLSNNIIAGSNNGARVNATSYDHANFGLNVSFAGSYRTNELQINSTNRNFKDITIYNGAAAALFVDPANYDFRIRPGNGFGGTGVAGDPRWFN